jgi:hypothetical protein
MRVLNCLSAPAGMAKRIQKANLLVFLAVLAVAGVACGASDTPGVKPSGNPSLRVGDPAPGFKLPSAQGGTVSLDEFRGYKPVLLYFSMGPG